MATTIAVRFPLGRYHATPWDRSVNEGAIEWPPSPWRLLRALVATWHARWPDLPASVLDGLLNALGDPPSYRTPPGRPAHTRHYLPDLDHKKGEPGGTDLTLDPFLRFIRDAEQQPELLIQWPTDLNDEQREALAKLAELLPYLGRAESVCEARLLDTNPARDGSWWRPSANGQHRTHLLAPTQPVSRAALEISTDQVRKQRWTLPPDTIWVNYAAAPAPARGRPSQPRAATIQALRFAVTGVAPVTLRHGVLLADAAHRAAGRKLAKAGVSDDRRSEILGTGGAATNHSHAHWVPLADDRSPAAPVKTLLLWVPEGLRPDEVAGILTLSHLCGRLGSAGYEVRGFPPVRLLFQGAGTITQMAPELCGPARRWRSLTPYLPVRHRKRREKPAEFLRTDISTELWYRTTAPEETWPLAVVTPTNAEAAVPDRWAREFRRYRLTEHMNKSRPGLGLRIELGDDRLGPLLLGQLSHFGYGIFMPENQ
jgi:CRISPR-associated protein Csb2